MHWLPGSGRTRVEIYDATGRRVRVLKHGLLSAGLHEILWDGMGARRQKMTPGVYLLRITTPSGAIGCKIELIGE